MKRTRSAYLKEWLQSPNRKPLVIRGARQVGKTWLVRHLAESEKRALIEINFEKQPQAASLFASNDPKQTLLNLSAALQISIDPKKNLLFLDEIQAAPELFARLRWFAEEMPELPVIAAGSLLEFVLRKHSFSMPVGRISYMHLEPLSFEEFLIAKNKEQLVNYLASYQIESPIPNFLHVQLMAECKEYLVIGGMPAAVSSWIVKQSLKEVHQIQHDLLATYRDDFAKYSGRIAKERLDEVMMSVPKTLGEKFVYSKVNPTIQINTIKQALDLLCKAKVCYQVQGSAANGIPLGAELQERSKKVIFLDVGLCTAILGLSLNQFQSIGEIIQINRGALAEQAVGQSLRTIEAPYVEPSLYYWHRMQKGSEAEIDYLLQHQNHVIPIEVKAGTTGSLKSLHLFMGLKQLPLAVRINSDLPSKTEVNVKDHQNNPISYTLLSIPFYLIEQLHRLLNRVSS